MHGLPTGTVTLLFTDIEGSTRLLEEQGERYATLLADHRRVLRRAFAAPRRLRGRYSGRRLLLCVRVRGRRGRRGFDRAGRRSPAGRFTCAWACTQERRLSPTRGTSAATSTAPPGSALRVTADRSSSRTRPVRCSRARSSDDLGEHRLKDLSEPRAALPARRRRVPARCARSTRRICPSPATPFLGRERELAEVIGLLRTSRMLTLTGPGGTGKTRLAAQAAAESAEQLPWRRLVDLARRGS